MSRVIDMDGLAIGFCILGAYFESIREEESEDLLFKVKFFDRLDIFEMFYPIYDGAPWTLIFNTKDSNVCNGKIKVLMEHNDTLTVSSIKQFSSNVKDYLLKLNQLELERQ